MIDMVGSAAAACSADAQLLQGIEGIGTHKAGKIAAALRVAAAEVDAELARAAAAGASLICPDDDAYSPLLREIPDPPLVLYVRGTIEPRDLNGVAIVGSRKVSLYGREQAERFAALLAGSGCTVISGGARGTDTAAHRGALTHPHGRTLAVLGSGVDVAYPPENAALFDQIAAGRGAILSEFPMGTSPAPENFPRRNRIVSGLSRGVLVVEAAERSGALITARQAADDHNRPVFALPGRVDNPLAFGPHYLIRDGATLVTKLEDILDDLGPLPHAVYDEPPPPPTQSEEEPDAPTPPPKPATLFEPTPPQQLILHHLSADPSSVDALIDRTGLEAAVVLRELTVLSLRGVARRVDGQRYALARRP